MWIYITTQKEKSIKCRGCNHCSNCKKDLKKGGGRHRLCQKCMINCFDEREGRKFCQKCYSKIKK